MNTALIVAFVLAANAGPGETPSPPTPSEPSEIPEPCKLDSAQLMSASGPWREGVDYKLLSLSQPTISGPKIEIVEFFAYWCPQCARLEPELEKWARPERDIALEQVPVVQANEHSRRYAALYYTFLALGRPELHRAFYEAIERSRKSGHGNLMSFEDHVAFAQDQGIDAAQFEQVNRSAEVAAAVAKAEIMMRDYEVNHAPMIVVQGRYRIEKNPESDTEDVLELTDFLIDRVRDESATPTSQVIRDAVEP